MGMLGEGPEPGYEADTPTGTVVGARAGADGAAAGAAGAELPCGLFKFCCAMFLRVARAPAMLTGSAGGAGFGRAPLRDANRFGGGLPGGVVDSSESKAS